MHKSHVEINWYLCSVHFMHSSSLHVQGKLLHVFHPSHQMLSEICLFFVFIFYFLVKRQGFWYYRILRNHFWFPRSRNWNFLRGALLWKIYFVFLLLFTRSKKCYFCSLKKYRMIELYKYAYKINLTELSICLDIFQIFYINNNNVCLL